METKFSPERAADNGLDIRQLEVLRRGERHPLPEETAGQRFGSILDNAFRAYQDPLLRLRIRGFLNEKLGEFELLAATTSPDWGYMRELEEVRRDFTHNLLRSYYSDIPAQIRSYQGESLGGYSVGAPGWIEQSFSWLRDLTSSQLAGPGGFAASTERHDLVSHFLKYHLKEACGGKLFVGECAPVKDAVVNQVNSLAEAHSRSATILSRQTLGGLTLSLN